MLVLASIRSLTLYTILLNVPLLFPIERNITSDIDHHMPREPHSVCHNTTQNICCLRRSADADVRNVL